MEGIKRWVEAEGTGHWFFVTFPLVLICLFIWFKGRRTRFLIPSLIISLVIINPLFYKAWTDFGLYAYWRALWIVPVIPVTASVVPCMCEKLRKPSLKATAAGAGVGIVILAGTFLYDGLGGAFIEAANGLKIPDESVHVAEWLLGHHNNPRIIADPSIGTYIRQYSGEIESLFGRDVYGYIAEMSNEAREVYSNFNDDDSDLASISQYMLDNNYDFLISKRKMGDCFGQIDTVDEYGIYVPIGAPNVKKYRNELGQVTQVTCIDELGTPINNEHGYSSVLYEFDPNGFVSREFKENTDGVGVADEYGIAGYERFYDRKGEIIMERTLGVDGTPYSAYQTYAEIRRVYRNGKIIKVSYYDEEGKPATQLAGHCGLSQVWDEKDGLTLITYLDETGFPTNRTDGFSTVDWSNVQVSFYNTEGEEVENTGLNLFREGQVYTDGWTKWLRPDYGIENCGFSLGYINLGDKVEGDTYSCQIEIEFRNVKSILEKPFLFQTQGAVDYAWEVANIWYPNVVHLTSAPNDGVYRYTACRARL